jgi:hypothetical protein
MSKPSWQRINQNCIQKGPYKICRVMHLSESKYVVYHEIEFLGWHSTEAQALEVVQQHSRGKSVGRRK